MHYINITVRNKVAVNPAQDRYICGNSDFVVRFDFDAEWDAFETKTARFIKEDGAVYDVVFSGNDCPVPVISDTYKLQVGVFAGNLSTTTAAYVPCKKSILCGGGVPAAPAEDVYNQIMAKVNENTEAVKEAKAAVDVGESGIYIVHARKVEGKYGYWPDRTIEEVRAAVAAGKTCLLIDHDGRVYTYCDERTSDFDVKTTSPTFIAPANYRYGTGIKWHSAQLNEYGNVTISYTEPAKTPNPHKLTVKQGETTAEYDGSKAVSVEIPDGVDEATISKLVEAKLNALLNPVILPETTVTGESGEGKILTPLSANPEVGKTYDVVFNGVTYACPAIRAEDNGIASVVLGNSDMMGIPGGNTAAPFVLILIPGGADMLGDGNLVYGLVVGIDESNTATISVKEATGNDQNKVDNSQITVHASQDGTLAISGIDKSFSEVLAALKNGAHVQLMLTRPDGVTEVYPVAAYTDTHITFILLPSHDTAWMIEWTESGMTQTLSGND